MADTWILQRQADNLEDVCLGLSDWQAEWLWAHPEYQDKFFWSSLAKEAMPLT
jgi:hypothetical protein